MRKIRVTVGTVGYYDAKHAHKRMTAADGPFECEDTQAEHFVSAGVAEYVGGVIEADEADEQEVTGHLAKSQLEEMTIQQLQNLAGPECSPVKPAVLCFFCLHGLIHCLMKKHFLFLIFVDNTEDMESTAVDDGLHHLLFF